MPNVKIIRRVRYTRATLHSDIWHGVGGKAPFSINESPSRILSQDGGFILVEASLIPQNKQKYGINVVFISDLHINGLQCSRYQQLAAAINELDADWIIFGGDLSVFADTVDEGMKWLGSLTAKWGKIAVLGNRESSIPWLDRAFWKRKYAEAGYKCLINDVFVPEEGNVAFYGIDDFRFGNPSWQPLEKITDRLCISVSHNPDAAASASIDTKIGDMVLCGHTHAGQLNLPFFGPLYTSSAYGRQFVHGWQERKDGTLCLTSAGIGESGFGILRNRLCCKREVVLLHF